MNITFIKEFIGFESGHSLYKVGDQATLRHGQRLINLGVAVEGWHGIVELEMQEVENPFMGITVKEIEQFAKNHNIELPNGSKKEKAGFLFLNAEAPAIQSYFEEE